MATLHSHLEPETLPSEFGGSKPEADQAYWAKRLIASEMAELKAKPVGENPLKTAAQGADNVSRPDSDDVLSNFATV